MTIQFPDVSQFTPVSLAGAPVAIARATIGLVKDTNYDRFVADAAAHGVPLLAYHFLDDEALGATPEAQADFCYSVVGRRALMLDDEPNRGYCASLAQSQRFINRFRDRGGIVHLDYLPKWSWSGWMGSPSLQPLQQLGVYVVSSNYTAYSDTGPGWSAYGGVTPVQWQFADNHLFNGVACDWNAFKDTVAAYLRLANGPAIKEIEMPIVFFKAAGDASGQVWVSDFVTRARVPAASVAGATWQVHDKQAGTGEVMTVVDPNAFGVDVAALAERTLTQAQVDAAADRIAATLTAAGVAGLSKTDLLSVLSSLRLTTGA